MLGRDVRAGATAVEMERGPVGSRRNGGRGWSRRGGNRKTKISQMEMVFIGGDNQISQRRISFPL
jgi:hypothetical protein